MPAGRRLRVGVLFGGRSGEHEISILSARSVIESLDPKKYEVIPLAITKDGRWLPPGKARAALAAPVVPDDAANGATALLPAPGGGALVQEVSGRNGQAIDVVFPVLHGPYGEDGTVQGLLELADVPYVGCGVLGSALGMDKDVQKVVLRAHGIRVPDWVTVRRHEWAADRDACLRAAQAIGCPCFVKPANLGSSIGISKVTRGADLPAAVDEALRWDEKALIEDAAENHREIECSVLGNDDPQASLPGEIIAHRAFYDYDAKYHDDATELIVPADLPLAMIAEVQRTAVAAFAALEGRGMARVDFLLEPGDRLSVCEINTIPGFTAMSMYARMWAASGLPYPALLDRLIDLALERHAQRAALAR